jgi:2-dehydropantoate 2-reductase
MNIAVIGAGALGTLFGGALAHHGETVWLVHHDPAVARTLDEEGVTITSEALPTPPTSVAVNATADATDVGHADLVLVLVKAHHTSEALDQHRACIGPETHLLTLQNGLALGRILAEFAPEERVLSGVTYQGAAVHATGEVEHTNVGETTFGGSDLVFAERVQSLFEAAGLGEISAVDDPQPAIWDKQLLGLAFKPMSALTRLPNGALVADESVVEMMDHLVTEGRAVAQAMEVDLPAGDVMETVVAIGEGNPTHRSSMLQDVLAGKKTEIASANGAIVELAEEAGIDVPYNRAVTTLVRGLEQSYLDE